MALRVAENHPGALLLTDCAAARRAARSLQIPVHRTIGLLVRSIRREQRSNKAVAAIHRELPHRSTRVVKPDLVNAFIRSVETSGCR